jgi:hypothetical protein
VRINKCDALAAPDVLEDHGFDEGGFSGARLADEVHMGDPVMVFDAEDLVGAAKISTGEVGDVGGVHAP